MTNSPKLLAILTSILSSQMHASGQSPTSGNYASRSSVTAAESRETPSGREGPREIELAERISPPTPPEDCCSQEAMKKIAGSLDYLDVVGIKLGMTPQQPIAAIKAHNSNLKIDVIPRETRASDCPWDVREDSTMDFGPFASPERFQPGKYRLEFTTPPNPPLLAKVARQVLFPNGHSYTLPVRSTSFPGHHPGLPH
jgi:hypothetical protein